MYWSFIYIYNELWIQKLFLTNFEIILNNF